jgi:hypothetical protein
MGLRAAALSGSITAMPSSQARPHFRFPDEPEREDIWEEAREVAGEPWLHTANERLAGRTPAEVIRSGDEGRALVRDILRSIRYIGSS